MEPSNKFISAPVAVILVVSFIFGVVNVLFVSVSVVARPTKVSVEVGNVNDVVNSKPDKTT